MLETLELHPVTGHIIFVCARKRSTSFVEKRCCQSVWSPTRYPKTLLKFENVPFLVDHMTYMLISLKDILKGITLIECKYKRFYNMYIINKARHFKSIVFSNNQSQPVIHNHRVL